jgi:hypothetical protein
MYYLPGWYILLIFYSQRTLFNKVSYFLFLKSIIYVVLSHVSGRNVLRMNAHAIVMDVTTTAAPQF